MYKEGLKKTKVATTAISLMISAVPGCGWGLSAVSLASSYGGYSALEKAVHKAYYKKKGIKVCTAASSTEKPAKSMQKAVVVYILYVHKFFSKSVYVKYQIFSSTYTKNIYTYIQHKRKITCIKR